MSKENKHKIIELYHKGIANKDIANMLSVNYNNVNQVIKRYRDRVENNGMNGRFVRDVLKKEVVELAKEYTENSEELINTLSRETGLICVKIVNGVAKQLEETKLIEDRAERETILLKIKFLQVASDMFKGK